MATGGPAHEPLESLRVVERLAPDVPAWVEPFIGLRHRLADQASTGGPDVAREGSTIDELQGSCPQLVDVDFPTMAFSRAEWVDGNLRLRLAPLQEAPHVFTSFRIVGAEPRNWDVHGFDGVSLDLTSTGLNVRVPLVSGDLELIRSSY